MSVPRAQSCWEAERTHTIHIGLLAADSVSAVFALYIAFFFMRGRSLAPRRGLGLLAVAFCALAIGYASASLLKAPTHPSAAALDAARAGSVCAASVLLFVYYGSRRAGWNRARTRRIVAAGVLLAAILAVASTRSGQTTALLSWTLVAGAILLIFTALLVTMEVRAQRLLDFRVPLGFLCLAFAQYTTAVLALHDAAVAFDGWPLIWRLTGLALLSSVVVTSGGVRFARKAA